MSVSMSCSFALPPPCRRWVGGGEAAQSRHIKSPACGNRTMDFVDKKCNDAPQFGGTGMEALTEPKGTVLHLGQEDVLQRDDHLTPVESGQSRPRKQPTSRLRKIRSHDLSSVGAFLKPRILGCYFLKEQSCLYVVVVHQLTAQRNRKIVMNRKLLTPVSTSSRRSQTNSFNAPGQLNRHLPGAWRSEIWVAQTEGSEA